MSDQQEVRSPPDGTCFERVYDDGVIAGGVPAGSGPVTFPAWMSFGGCPVMFPCSISFGGCPVRLPACIPDGGCAFILPSWRSAGEPESAGAVVVTAWDVPESETHPATDRPAARIRADIRNIFQFLFISYFSSYPADLVRDPRISVIYILHIVI